MARTVGTVKPEIVSAVSGVPVPADRRRLVGASGDESRHYQEPDLREWKANDVRASAAYEHSRSSWMTAKSRRCARTENGLL
jgi:LPS sulfotransferase NodH